MTCRGESLPPPMLLMSVPAFPFTQKHAPLFPRAKNLFGPALYICFFIDFYKILKIC